MGVSANFSQHVTVMSFVILNEGESGTVINDDTPSKTYAELGFPNLSAAKAAAVTVPWLPFPLASFAFPLNG
jgi:hypothetical protein